MVAFLVTFIIVLAVLLSAVFVNLSLIWRIAQKDWPRRHSDYSQLDDMLFE
jgi:energy-converting hydrogenase Eha subunit A